MRIIKKYAEILFLLFLIPFTGNVNAEGEGVRTIGPGSLDEIQAPEIWTETVEYRAPLRTFGVEEGLLHNSIRSLLIDRKGYLWIGTYGGGVFRFDGDDFEKFDRSDGLPSDRVLSLYEDQEGRIWIGTVKGLARYDGNSMRSFVEPDHCKEVQNADCREKLLVGVIYDITEDKAGNIWVATAGGGAVRYDGDIFTYFVKRGYCKDTLGGDCAEILPGNVVRTVEIGPKGLMWIGTFEEGMVAQGEHRTDYFGNPKGCEEHGAHYDSSTELPIGSNVFWSSYLDSRDRLWVGTPQGLLRKDESGWKLFREHDGCNNGNKKICKEVGLPYNITTELTENRDSSYWIGSFRGVARMQEDSVTRTILNENGLAGQHVADVVEGPDRTTWLGTQGGLQQYLSNAIELFDHRGGLLTDRVQAMAKDEKGRIWIGESDGDGALSRWDGGKTIEHLIGKEMLKQKAVTDLHVGADASVWIATNGGGVYRYKKDRIEHYGKKLLPKGNVFAVHETRDGTVWMAGEKGAARIEDGSITQFGMQDGLSHYNLTSIAEDGTGRVWIGTPLGGINIHRNSTFMVLRKGQGMNTDRIKDITRGPDGGMWVATYGDGVQVMRNPEELNSPDDAEWERITIADGLPSNQVKGLYFDEKERLWVGTELGAAQIDPESGKVRRTLERSDGFLGINCTGAISSDEKGRILFGTGQYLIRYDPEKDTRKKVRPPLHIQGVTIGYSPVDWHDQKDSLRKEIGAEYELQKGSQLPQKLSLPNERSHLVIDFQAIDLRAPDKVRYRYRLLGSSEEWSPWQKEDQAVFNDLPPGKYRFELQARTEDGLQSKEEKHFEFRIRPAWWNSTLFRTSSVVGAALLAFLIFQWRTAAIRNRKLELEEKVQERTEEVERQRAELATKNQEITDSIDYASSIQKALFPEPSVLQNALGEHFVLYRPRDPVSGDLYWCYAPSSDLAIWMLVDCTGHGVPGAFMSVMANNLLDEVVVKDGNRDPGQVLDRLRERTIEKLGEERRDGMEAALCIWDKMKGELRFAGANIPLFLVRENLGFQEPEFQILSDGEASKESEDEAMKRYQPFKDNVNGGEFRGDHQRVSAEEGEARGPFQSIRIKLEPEDRLYCFTDGFPDQFGGPKDKKYGRRRFKRILASNAFRPMEEQREDLDLNLREWQGEREQIDDICVLGVRISDPAPASRSASDGNEQR